MTPERVVGKRVEAVLLVPEARDPETDRSEIGRLVGACRSGIAFMAADSALVNDRRPPSPVLREPLDGPAVVISVLPVEGGQPNCNKNPALELLLPTRGIRITYDSLRYPDRSVRRVEVTRRGQPVIPAAMQGLEVLRLGPAGFREPQHAWSRLTFSLASLAPDERGRYDDLVLTVHTQDGPPETLRIPSAMVERALVAALAPAGDRGGKGTLPLTLPTPNDEGLRVAQQWLAEGEAGRAAALGAARATFPGVRHDDRVWGLTSAGLAFDAIGNEAAGRVALAHALRVEPCLKLDPAIGEAVVARVEQLADRSVRCKPMPWLSTVVRAAALPGFGRSPTPSNGIVRAAIPVSMAVFAASAVGLGASARRTYDEYLDWRYQFPEPPGRATPGELFDKAESQRRMGQLAWTAFGVIYGGQFLHTVWEEQRLRSRVRRFGSFGSPVEPARARNIGLAPLVGPGTGGLVVRIDW